MEINGFKIEKFNQYNQDEKVRRIRRAEKILREKLSILNGLKNNKIYAIGFNRYI